jgi:uncharacterized membrane protein HdeD (DUF308 family)
MHDDERTSSTNDRRSSSSTPRTTPEPMWRVMQVWSPVAAGVLRATAGIVMFAASLLTLPSTLATPFLTGVSLVMLIGGVASVMRHCRDDERLRTFGRYFPVVVAALAGAAVVATLVLGPGAFAPRLTSPPPPVDDGTIRFSP